MLVSQVDKLVDTFEVTEKSKIPKLLNLEENWLGNSTYFMDTAADKP